MPAQANRLHVQLRTDIRRFKRAVLRMELLFRPTPWRRLVIKAALIRIEWSLRRG